MSLFSKNLQAIREVDKNLELRLNKVTKNEIYEVFLENSASVDNANFLNHRDKTLMYDNARDEISQKLFEFEQFDNYPILYFFGFGNGSFYKQLLENPKHQHIMIIEPEIEIIYIVLHLVDFSQEILENRILLKLSAELDKQYFLEELNDRSRFFLRVYDFHVYNTYYDRYREEIDRVNKAIVTAFKHLIYTIGNCAADSLIGLEYSLKNIPKMLKTPTLVNVGKNKNTETALIVSTGPSLAKQLPLLKKIKDYVTIMCIDASFPILAKEGIKPDIVFSIERVDLTGKFYKDTPKEFHKDVLFSLATVCHDETINNIHGQKCFFMRADSYNVFFGLEDWGYLGGGMSAANFAFDFAAKAPYTNIVFIGQDLAYGKDGSSHSKNHVFGEDEVKNEQSNGKVDAYGGVGEVETTTIWKAFLNSFETQVKTSTSRCINATEGGARIHGTEEMPFHDVAQNIINTKQKKKLIKVSLPDQETVDENMKKFVSKEKEAVDIGKSMIKVSKKLFKEFDTFLKMIDNYSSIEIEESVTIKKLDKMIEKISEVKNKYNDAKFSNMYATLLLAYVINHEFEVAEVYVMRENTDLARKKKKIAWIRVHTEWLYRVYTNTEAIVKLLEKSLKD